MGDFNLYINIKSKDEIGELANTFKLMVQRIKEQISIIERDRDSLMESQKQNKVFFDNVTHELKTPLTTILGYAQVIKENGFNDKDFFDKGISYIINESKRLNDMVINILELSTVSTGNSEYNFEKIDLSKLTETTCEEMSIKGKKYNIDIHFNNKKPLYVRGDYNRLREVLVNIIDNSIKYGNVNSVIDVEVYSRDEIINLMVRDRGSGIPPAHIDRIFEPFYRISKHDSREKGSAGLGLSIVKNILDRHDAKISINSRLNEGTEIIIQFRRWLHE
jgi:signal transduction histidine kinase